MIAIAHHQPPTSFVELIGELYREQGRAFPASALTPVLIDYLIPQ
ncbi:hypothetical protein [Mycobacterium spongiae]|nr:hypothetical protein [Mycobacterium spongiae]